MSRAKELLSSERFDGVWHAAYPTAERTLCGLLMPAQRRRGRRNTPDCPGCLQTARLFHAIDQSAPAHWGIKVTARERGLEQQLAA